MSEEQKDAMVAEALAAAIRDLGVDLRTEPRRVQGLMSDVLGADARTRRAEVDAVVLAAEEGVPDDLLARRIEQPEAVARLRARGLGDDVAGFAVDVWAYALGLLEDGAEAPSLTRSLQTPPQVTDPAPEELIALGATVTPPIPPPPPPPYVAASPFEQVGAPRPRGRRKLWAGAGAVVGVAAVIALVATIVLADDGTVTPPKPKPPVTKLARVTFPAETTPLGELTRTWSEGDDGTVAGKVEITNSGEAPTSGRHVEVIPKSLAESAEQITSEPAHVVLDPDPVIAWDVALEPGASFSATYTIAVEGQVDLERLSTWKEDRAQAAIEFAAESTRSPKLTISDPTEGAVLAGDTYDVTGATDPGATVSIGGTEVTVNPDGTWQHRVTGAPSILVRATSPYGVTTELRLNVQLPKPVVVTPPVVTPPETDTPTKKCPNGATVAVGATCPTQTKKCPNGATVAIGATCPTQTKQCPNGSTVAVDATCPPIDTSVTCWDGSKAPTESACPLRPISISLDGERTALQNCPTAFWIVANGFTPTNVDWPGDGEYDGKNYAVLYFYNVSSGTTFSVTATAPDGRTVKDSMTVQVIPQPPTGC